MTIAAQRMHIRLPAIPCAVVWISKEWASLARMSREGAISTSAVHRGGIAEPAYLDLIVRLLGDAQRVVILGPEYTGPALDRAYAAIHRWPDRLVDVELSEPMGTEALIERLQQLASPVER